MNATRAVRISGHTQAELAAHLGMDIWQFNKKLHNWNGMDFTPDQKAQLRTLGVPEWQIPEPDPSPEAA